MNGINIQEFFQLLNNNNLRRTDPFQKIVVSQNQIVSLEEYNSYSKQVKEVYNSLFSQKQIPKQDQKRIVLDKILKFQVRKTAMPICNKLLTHNQPVYRCYDCTTHESAVLCQACFQNGSHKGHRYIKMNSGGGNCDCGNPDAISPQGFCVKHPGKAEPTIIDQKQELQFITIMKNIFSWFFAYYSPSSIERVKKTDIFGFNLGQYLQKLNRESLYYNTLTDKLFFTEVKDSNGQQIILTKIFRYGIKCTAFSKKIIQVFFNMFSLSNFKYKLAVQFTKSYNTFKGFQSSPFKSLFIQLFANNDIVMKLIQNKQIICPYDLDYDQTQYIQNMLFLGTIKKQVGQKYFQALIQKGIIPTKMLKQIQKVVQNGNQHIVNIINTNLNNQNYYYSFIITVIKLLQHNQKLTNKVLVDYFQQIQSQEYSFSKNKVIIPYERVFGLVTFAIFQGDLSKVNAERVAQILGKETKIQIFNTIKLIFQRTFKCMKQFAQTFLGASYFDNYIPLYIKSGYTIVAFDILTLRICTILMSQIKPDKILNITSQLINYSVSQQFNKIQLDSTNQQQMVQNILTNVRLSRQCLKLMIQICISNRQEVLVSDNLQIKTKFSQEEKERIIISLYKNFPQLMSDDLKSIQKHFFSKNVQQIYKKYLPYDKIKKKHVFTCLNSQNYKRYPLQYIQTLKKVGGIFHIDKKQQNLARHDMFLNTASQYIAKTIFSDQFVQILCMELEHYIQKMIIPQKYKQSIKTIQAQFIQSLNVLKTINTLMFFQKNAHIKQFIQKLYATYKKSEDKFAFLSQFYQDKQSQMVDESKERLIKKLNLKKLKRKIELKSMQDKFNTDHIKEDLQDSSKCIVCKQQSINNKNNLCYLSGFKYSNLLQSITGCEGKFLTFSSCFHPIHVQCFIKNSSQNRYMPCPLCKAPSNIMIPIEQHIQNQTIVNDVVERIQVLKCSWKISKSNTSEEEEYITLSLLNSIVQMIGMTLIRNEHSLNSKQQRLAKSIYLMIKKHFLKMQNDLAEKHVQVIRNYLKSLSERVYQNQGYSAYVLFKLILKLLFSCLVNENVYQNQIIDQFKGFLLTSQIQYCWKMVYQVVNLAAWRPNMAQWKQSQAESLAKYQIKDLLKFYQPPQNIYDLIQLRDQKNMDCKNGHQVCICLICKWKGCFDCKQTKKHIQTEHCGQGLVFNSLTGGFLYYWKGSVTVLQSNYVNQLGASWKPSKKPQGFFFDHQAYKQIIQNILKNQFLSYLTAKYPDTTRNIFLIQED